MLPQAKSCHLIMRVIMKKYAFCWALYMAGHISNTLQPCRIYTTCMLNLVFLASLITEIATFKQTRTRCNRLFEHLLCLKGIKMKALNKLLANLFSCFSTQASGNDLKAFWAG